MNILKRTYAKLKDRITIEEAPGSLNGIIGFSNNVELCLENGYKPVTFLTGIGNLAVYEETETEIVQSYITIDLDIYSNRVSELIRQKYTIDNELAIHRKRISSPIEFQAYYDFCEECKKTAKLEQMNNIIN